MTKDDMFLIEMNIIARTNISEIEKKRRQQLLLEKYKKDLKDLGE